MWHEAVVLELETRKADGLGVSSWLQIQCVCTFACSCLFTVSRQKTEKWHRLTFNCSCIYFNYVSQGMAMNTAGLRVGN